MFSIDSHHIKASSTEEAAAKLQALMTNNDSQFLIGFCEADLLKEVPKALSPSAPCLIASSCLGSSTDSALTLNQPSISLLSIQDKDGFYGVASRATTKDFRAEAAATLLRAMQNSGHGHVSPNLIWCYQTPGHEEQVLLGIQDVVGTKVPVFGGSCADNSILGNWGVYDGANIMTEGFVIAVLYPSVNISGYFSSGYSLTEFSGQVTKVVERRLEEINDLPALSVVNQWRTQLDLPPFQDGNILAASTMTPLARLQSSVDDIPVLLLSHPAMAENNQLTLFSDVHEGETIYLAHGTREQLIERGPQVIRTARELAGLRGVKKIEGAIVIFCGGCMLSIQDSMHEIQMALTHELPGIPFIMGFTFGELGTFSDGTNRHGNLMISCTLFGGSNDS